MPLYPSYNPRQYTNPGDAASSAIEDFALQRAALEHQRQMDELAREEAHQRQQNELSMQQYREKQLASIDADRKERETQRKEDLARQQEREDRASAKELTADMVPGDTLAALDEPTRQKVLKYQGTAFDQPTPFTGPEPEGVPTPAPDPMRYRGTPVQRAAIRLGSVLADTTPESPQGKQAMIQYEAETGKPFQTQLVKPNTTEAVFRQDAKKGVVERLVDGQWLTWPGDAPQGSHWMTEPQPKDISARDVAQENHLNTVRQQRYKELDDSVKNTHKHLDALDNALSLMGAKNTKDNPNLENQADSTLAEAYLNATSGGNVRISKPLLDKIQKDPRNIWTSMMLKINAWNTDKSQPLMFDPDQKAAMREIVSNMRDNAYKAHQRYIKARRAITEADNVKDVNRVADDALDELVSPGDVQSATTTPTPTPTPTPKAGVGFTYQDYLNSQKKR